MDRRYQVFLSSTYEDLKEERLEVMKALLELDCIPCGMEYFPAANEDQWSYIKSLIDDCDYYVVVVAGRYGSTDSEGKSYTQKEYEYAVSQGIPVIAFLHKEPGKIPADRTESSPVARKKVKAFREICRGRLCKDWTSVHELGAVVSRGLTQIIKRTPRSGWVRSDSLASAEASKEILDLRRQLEHQREEIIRISLQPPPGSQDLAQGHDRFPVNFSVELTKDGANYQDRNRIITVNHAAEPTWDQLFGSFAPKLLAPTVEVVMRTDIARMLRDMSQLQLARKYKGYTPGRATISEGDFQTVRVQFHALGLIESRVEVREKERGERTVRLCELTPLGRRQLITVKAIRRDPTDPKANKNGGKREKLRNSEITRDNAGQAPVIRSPAESNT